MAGDTAVCSTCDDLPMATPEQARRKAQCLLDRAPNHPDRAKLDQRLRVLLVLEADHLTVQQRAAARAAFSERLQSASCEPQFVAPIPSECSGSARVSLDATLAYCARLAGAASSADPGVASAVRTSVAWVEASECIALLERVANALSPASAEHACASPELADTVHDAVLQVMRGAVMAIDERRSIDVQNTAEASFPELDRTLALIDRWYTVERTLLVARSAPGLEESTGALKQVTGAFWAAAHYTRDTVGDLASVGPGQVPDLTQALDQTSQRADRLDRDVLSSLFHGRGLVIPAVMDGTSETLPVLPVATSVASGDVLLELAADALTGLARRLERSQPFHDMGCRLGGCGPNAVSGNLASTPSASLYTALGALDSGEELAAGGVTLRAALERLPATEPWRLALAEVDANQSALRAAVDGASAETQSVLLSRAAPQGLLLPALPLASIVRGAAARARNFAATGLLGFSADRQLRANVSSDGRAATIAAVNAALAAFSEDIRTFQNDRRQAVDDAIRVASVDHGVDAAERRLAEVDRARGLLHDDVRGLEAALAALDANVGEAAKLMADIAGPLDTGAFVAVGDTRRFDVRGFNGRNVSRVRANSSVVEDFAVRDIEAGAGGLTTIPVSAGEFVVVEATGEYSPLCSLQEDVGFLDKALDVLKNVVKGNVGLPPPKPKLRLEPQPGTTIGPEGFELVQERGTEDVQAVDRDFKDSPAVQQVIGAVSAAANGSVPGSGGAVAGSIQRGLNILDPVEDSSGAKQAEAVRFHGGLRLPDTPFPDLPAGALFLVELPRGTTRAFDIAAVHLIQRPSTSFVVSADSDLYFVINDNFVPDKCQSLSPADDPHKVTVTLRLATPTAEVARSAIAALLDITRGIAARRSEFLAQGRVLGSQLTQIVADAELRLQTQTGIDQASFPSVLRDLIRAYVQREVAAIEIAVEKQQLQRRQADLLLEADGVIRDVAAALESQQVATLLPLWRLRTFDQLQNGTDELALVEVAERLAGDTAETLVPILEVWHPDALRRARSRTDFKEHVRALVSPPPGEDALQQVSSIARVHEILTRAFAEDPVTHFQDPLNQPIVAVSFPRPKDFGENASTSGLPSANEGRSRAVWNAIESAFLQGAPVPPRGCVDDGDCVSLPGTRCHVEGEQPSCIRAPTSVTFGIDAEDVYRRNGGQATLSCFLAAPVVQQWALYFANQASDFGQDFRVLSQQQRFLVAESDEHQRFPTEQGLLDYVMTDKAALKTEISLLYGSDEEAPAVFQEFANGRLLKGRDPVGLSALSELSVDFAPLASMRHSFGNGIGEVADRPTSELVLLMRLDAREFASTPVGHELESVVRKCQDTPANRSLVGRRRTRALL
jgi:hypothetical protein